MKYRVVVMTYKRKQFNALNLLSKDANLELYLAVRKSEYDNGYYDHLKNKHNLKFMLLTNSTDAGDTRQEILEKCYADNIDYCIQLDDAVNNLYNPKDKTMSITDCILASINELTNNINSNKIIAMAFKENCKYLSTMHAFATQAFMINVKLMMSSKIKFVQTKICGFDDTTFTYEAYANNFYIIYSKNCNRDCRSWKPTILKSGGCHIETSSIEQQIIKSNYRMQLCANYLSKYKNYKKIIKTRVEVINGKEYKYDELLLPLYE